MTCPRCNSTETPYHAGRSPGRVCAGCGFAFDPVHYMTAVRDRVNLDHNWTLV